MCACIYVRAKSLQLCLTLCDPVDCSTAGSSDHGILQASIVEWGAMPFSRGSSQPRDRRTCISRIAGGFFTSRPPGKLIYRLLGLSRGLASPWQAYTRKVFAPV